MAVNQSHTSLGDTLRDIGELHVIKDDFLVVRGDIITNIDLQDALKVHYHIKQEEKTNMNVDGRKNNTIMTKLFMAQSNSSPLKDTQSEISLLIDRQTKEIYKYQSIYNKKQKKVNPSIQINDESIALPKSYGAPAQEAKFPIRVNNSYGKGTSLQII